MRVRNAYTNQYRLLLEQIRRKMKESKVKPIEPINTNGEQTYEQVSEKQNKKRKS